MKLEEQPCLARSVACDFLYVSLLPEHMMS